MTNDNGTRRAGGFGEGKRDGQGESGEQMALFAVNLEDNATTSKVSLFKKAQARAEEALEYLAYYQMAWQAAVDYALACARDDVRIEGHTLVAAMKEAGGDVVPIDNNHVSFLLRMLARSSERIAEHVQLRSSMYDLLDLNKYAAIVQNLTA